MTSGRAVSMWAVGQAAGVMVSKLKPVHAWIGTTDRKEWRVPLLETERGPIGDPGEHRFICYEFAELLTGLTREDLQQPRRIRLRAEVLG